MQDQDKYYVYGLWFGLVLRVAAVVGLTAVIFLALLALIKYIAN
jgi:hypothetical protein